ncbi:hypothetical protein D3C87_2089040 [compost metagenome]
MTGDAAVVLEALIAVFLVEGQDARIAQQVLIETGSGCQQGALVGGQGALNVGLGHCIRVRRAEACAVV